MSEKQDRYGFSKIMLASKSLSKFLVAKDLPKVTAIRQDLFSEAEFNQILKQISNGESVEAEVVISCPCESTYKLDHWREVKVYCCLPKFHAGCCDSGLVVVKTQSGEVVEKFRTQWNLHGGDK